MEHALQNNGYSASDVRRVVRAKTSDPPDLSVSQAVLPYIMGVTDRSADLSRHGVRTIYKPTKKIQQLKDNEILCRRVTYTVCRARVAKFILAPRSVASRITLVNTTASLLPSAPAG